MYVCKNEGKREHEHGEAEEEGEGENSPADYLLTAEPHGEAGS